MTDHLDPALVALPLYIVAVLWERRVLARRRAAGDDVVGLERRDSLASLGMGAVSVLTVGLLNLAVFALATLLWRWRVTDLGTGAAAWVAGMVGWDLAYYGVHRTEHEVRFFWAQHVNHHSSQHYNLTTALRQPWAPMMNLVLFPPLALLGIRPWIIMVCGGFNLIYQFWIHTEVVDRLWKPAEFVLNTPSHHRVHHGSNRQYLDRNLGGILIVWDRLFGTFEPEGERVRYGLTTDIESFNLWTIFSHELVAIGHDVAAAGSWRDRVGYVLGPPGWSPREKAATMPSAPSSQVGGR